MPSYARPGVPAPPVFIVGAPRSGTSLLYKLLCLHPAAAWISNWHRRLPAVSQVAVLNRLATGMPDRRRAAWFGVDGANAYVYGQRRALWQRLMPMPVEGEPVFRWCGLTQTGTTGPHATPRLRRTYDVVARWGGGAVVVNKRIANNRRIPALLEAFPDARFVHVVRDGRAVAYSLSRVDWWPDEQIWWYGGQPGDWAAEGRDPWDLAAEHWVREVDVVDRGLAAPARAGQVLALRYDELVDDPLGTLHRVAAFAGMPPDSAWVDELRQLSYPRRDDRWRNALEPDAVARIEAIQRDRLGALGFSS